MSPTSSKTLRIRDLGYTPGILPPGPSNSILDVPGVHVSQVTVPTSPDLPRDSNARKGVTIICPRPLSEYYKPCHAGSFTFNGNGEVTGCRQIADWGFTNTPLALTNSLSLGTVFDGIWDWVLEQQDGMGWDGRTRSRNYGTPIVGETADWAINCELGKSRVPKEEVRRCFEGLKDLAGGGEIEEGQFGGGAGMTCQLFAGGTGTASRKVGGGEGSDGEYTLGVLVQSNYGHLIDFAIGGVPVGRILHREKEEREGKGSSAGGGIKDAEGRAKDGSIVIIIITDAPLATHQLNRVARHATAGLASVGTHGIGRNFSGDIFIALSTAEHGPEQLENVNLGFLNPTQTYKVDVVKQESIDHYFYACAEAVEEAILNSIVGGRDGVIGMDGRKIDGLPVERVRELLEKHLVKV